MIREKKSTLFRHINANDLLELQFVTKNLSKILPKKFILQKLPFLKNKIYRRCNKITNIVIKRL